MRRRAVPYAGRYTGYRIRKADEIRADDIAFIRALVKKIDKDYKTDPGRRYFGGQSNGCMMTQAVGMEIPELFAALGSTSGPIIWDIPEETATEVIPAYMLMGQFDFWSWDLNVGGVKTTLDYWLNRNGLAGIDEPASVTTMGRYTTYEWQNKDGVPLYRYTQTARRGHSILPEEMELLWDWYSMFRIDPVRGRMYQRTPIR